MPPSRLAPLREPSAHRGAACPCSVNLPPEPALPPPAADITVVETKNVTNFESHAEGLAHRPADLTFFQEHGGSTTTMNRLKGQLRSIHTKQLIFTGPDPNRVQPFAGVGAIAMATDTLFELEPRSARLASVQQLCRAQLVAHGKGKAGGLCFGTTAMGTAAATATLPKQRLPTASLQPSLQNGFYFFQKGLGICNSWWKALHIRMSYSQPGFF